MIEIKYSQTMKSIYLGPLDKAL